MSAEKVTIWGAITLWGCITANLSPLCCRKRDAVQVPAFPDPLLVGAVDGRDLLSKYRDLTLLYALFGRTPRPYALLLLRHDFEEAAD